MDGNKSHYVIVGGFVLVMLAALIFALIRLSGWTATTESYFVVFTNVSGIKEGSKVLYEGYPIGSVAGVEPLSAEEAASLPEFANAPATTRFRLDLEVEAGWPIDQSARAQLAAPGFLSAVIVSITESDTAPSGTRKLLPVGSLIPAVESESLQTVIRSLGGRVDAVAKSIEMLVAEAQATLTDRVNPTIDEVHAFVEEARQDVPVLLDKANASVDEVQVLLAEARSFTSQANRDTVEQFLRRLDVISSDLQQVTTNANRLVSDARAVISENRPNFDKSITSFRYVMEALARDIDTINRNLEGTSRNMYEFSRQIRQNPGVLLGGTSRGDRR